ncbi:MAG: group 1 glycosyl transferase [Candidatus Saccharibacteria bacterium]|nr:group 1 glycosyl transferase [Candidatus Saccharibacteria bacterium]
MRKKVFFDALPLAATRQSGIGKVTEETIRALCRNEYFLAKHELIGFVPLGKRNILVEKFKDLPVKIVTIPVPNKIQEIFLRTKTMPPLDLILGRGTYLFFNYRNFPLLKSQSVTYVYDLGFIDFPQFAEKRNRKYLTKYIQRWTNRTDIIVTISQYSKSRIRELLNVEAGKIEVIYCGVDSVVEPAKNITENILLKYGLSKNYLLFVGNIEPRKNLTGLVEGFSKTSQKIKEDYQLVIIGADGWSNGEIYDAIELARKNGCQIIIPERFVTDKELVSIRSQASAVISTSFYEGFSIPPLEALAQHVPIALSNIAVHTELYEDRAVFFDPYDANDIAKGITTILEQKDRPIENEFVTKYSWDSSADKLAETIYKLEA